METRSRMSRSLHTNRDFEKLEPYEGKPSRTVLRGEEGSNALDLPDRISYSPNILGLVYLWLQINLCFAILTWLLNTLYPFRPTSHYMKLLYDTLPWL